MKWFKQNNVELVLGISATFFLINLFTIEDFGLYVFSIPFLVLGIIMLYKRHYVFNTTVAHNNSIFNAYDDDEDELYEDAKEAVIEAGKASTSFIQRKLRVGYSRAARLMDMLEAEGVIGPAKGAEPRKIMSE